MLRRKNEPLVVSICKYRTDSFDKFLAGWPAAVATAPAAAAAAADFAAAAATRTTTVTTLAGRRWSGATADPAASAAAGTGLWKFAVGAASGYRH